MKVDLIDRMGSDLDVVNAARVSFDKESDWDRSKDTYPGAVYDLKLIDQDKKLISYLAKHKHWSPFSHCFVKFRIKAPIFVARQLQKHVVGLAWNEVSRRYVDSPPEFHTPNHWRKRAENVKQGSSDATVYALRKTETAIYTVHDAYDNAMHRALSLYNDMVEAGICPEQARMVLPQSMYTEWIWSGSLYAFARVCKQRLDPHAQAETRYIAAQIAEEMKTLFPVSWEALMENP